MLRDIFVTQLMKRLGNRTDTPLQQDIINEMVQVQETHMERDLFSPWFLIKETTTLATIVGAEAVAFPTDFLKLWDFGELYRYDVTQGDPYIEMIRRDWDEIKACLFSSGIPTHYDLAGSNFLMRPLADAVYPLRLWYVAKAASLAGVFGDGANVENVWLEHASDWMFGEVGMIIAEQYLQMKPDKVQRFEKQAIIGRERVRRLNIAMEEALKVEIKGG